MRGARSAQVHEEEEESVFVSMTDMTISFLFILMILLAFFASQFSEDDKVPKSEYEQVVTQRNIANKKVEELTLKVTDLQNQLEIEKKKNRQLESEIKALKEKIEKLKEQIQKLEEAIKQLRKQDPLEKYLKDSAEVRKKILETLRDQLKIDFPTLDVIVNKQSDALHFQGDGLFALNSFELSPSKRLIVESIARRLNDILPCYTTGPKSNLKDGCNPVRATIEAVQIEGHTDSTGTPDANLQLSTQRANTTFTTMHSQARDLLLHKNMRDQPVLSVAGYGDMRPIASNLDIKGQATNRRIDLRIIMYTPTDLSDIQRIRDALNTGQPMVRVQ